MVRRHTTEAVKSPKPQVGKNLRISPPCTGIKFGQHGNKNLTIDPLSNGRGKGCKFRPGARKAVERREKNSNIAPDSWFLTTLT